MLKNQGKFSSLSYMHLDDIQALSSFLFKKSFGNLLENLLKIAKALLKMGYI